MSLSTPPPASLPFQNHGSCGPPGPSAPAAWTGQPPAGAPPARELGRRFRFLDRPAANAEHVRVADADERLDVEPPVEPGSDDADPQPLGHGTPGFLDNLPSTRYLSTFPIFFHTNGDDHDPS